ncbi:methyl-accepting chemotaxis protein [Oceanobacillus luteolus]|uniref:Methyl-accepting chemotaxis protein n=1 Tax=Oceanobacillus luteolus TaxID=1274358 RepID=A0ABW4HNV7_9BACI|nr:methyl-accepting chemotaxis protein [Oceanobacillus luteolus]
MRKKAALNKNKKQLRPSGLRVQLTIPFVILIVLAIGIVAFVSYNFSVRTTTNELSKNVEQQMTSVNHTFEMYFENMENALTRMANHNYLRAYNGNNFSDLFTYLQETSTASDDIKAAYAGYDSREEIVYYPYNEEVNKINPKERVWYQQAVEEEGEIVWTEPYSDALSGEIVVTAAKAFYQYNELVGTAGIDVSTTSLLELMNDIQIGDNGYAVVIDESGNFITHPDQSKLSESISEQAYYQDIMAAGEQGLIRSSVNGEDMIIGFVKNPTTDWIIAGFIHEAEFASKASVIMVPILITLGIVLIVAIIAAVLVANRLIKPIKKLQSSMQKVEAGDLTATIILNREDEIGQLSKSFNHMVSEMRKVIDRISFSSNKVSDAAQNLVASSEENSASAYEVARTMEEIAAGASNQADLTEQNAKAFGELSQMINEIKDKNEQMYEKARDMDRLSSSGIETIQSLAARSAETSQVSEEVVGAIEQLNEKSTNIHSIVDKISTIASQTNLLALNASIEAARAGEHGHGFAVVANEVGKLAEQTTNALKDVAAIISEMQEMTKESVELVKHTMQLFEQQTESVGDTGQAFLAISNSVKENNDMTEQIVKLTNAIVDMEKALVANTKDYASISEETAAGTEEISASVEQQTASMEQLTNLATELESIANTMQKEINNFKIN